MLGSRIKSSLLYARSILFTRTPNNYSRVRVGNENNYCGGGALRRDRLYKRLNRLQGLIVRKVVCSVVFAASDGGRDGKAVSSCLVAVSADSLEEFYLAGVLAT